MTMTYGVADSVRVITLSARRARQKLHTAGLNIILQNDDKHNDHIITIWFHYLIGLLGHSSLSVSPFSSLTLIYILYIIIVFIS